MYLFSLEMYSFVSARYKLQATATPVQKMQINVQNPTIMNGYKRKNFDESTHPGLRVAGDLSVSHLLTMSCFLRVSPVKYFDPTAHHLSVRSS